MLSGPVRVISFLGAGAGYTSAPHATGTVRSKATGLSALALWELGGADPDDTVVFLGTSESEAYWVGSGRLDTEITAFERRVGRTVRWMFKQVDAGRAGVDALYRDLGPLLDPAALPWTAADGGPLEGGPRGRVVLDVTHGYRIQPIIAVGALLAAEARLARAGATVRHEVWYAAEGGGAFPEHPLWEITGVLGAAQWARAVDVFERFGRADHLAALLTEAGMVDLAKRVVELADGLATVRAGAVGAAADAAGVLVKATTGGPAWRDEAMGAIGAAAGALGGSYAAGGGGAALQQTLAVAREMRVRQQFAAAVLVLGELLTDLWVTFRTGEEGAKASRAVRERQGAWLTGLGVDELCMGDPKVDRFVRDLWERRGRLAELRNDIAHAGRRVGARTSGQVRDEVLEHERGLEALIAAMPSTPMAPRQGVIGVGVAPAGRGFEAPVAAATADRASGWRDAVLGSGAAIVRVGILRPEVRHDLITMLRQLGLVIEEPWQGEWVNTSSGRGK